MNEKLDPSDQSVTELEWEPPSNAEFEGDQIIYHMENDPVPSL